MQDARQEIDSFANISPNILSQDDSSEHSGVAINMLQKAGIAELGSFFRNYSDWKERVYRATWNIIKHTWQAERFIRVTDNQGLAQFIQLNGMDVDEYGEPVIVNAIGELSVEIEIDDGPDTSNLMQDAYDVLKQDPTVPWQIKIFFMPISDTMKKQVMSMINKPPDPIQANAAQIQLHQLAAELEKTKAQTADIEAQSSARHAGAITNVARAGHLAHEAKMDVAQFVREGFIQATRDQTPDSGPSQQGAPAQPSGPLPRQPMPQPSMPPRQMPQAPMVPRQF